MPIMFNFNPETVSVSTVFDLKYDNSLDFANMCCLQIKELNIVSLKKLLLKISIFIQY